VSGNKRLHVLERIADNPLCSPTDRRLAVDVIMKYGAGLPGMGGAAGQLGEGGISVRVLVEDSEGGRKGVAVQVNNTIQEG
jgi:hypothetical protein